jgi:hypothetical protein
MAGCSDDAVDQPDGSAAPGGDAEKGAGAEDEEPADEADDDWITFESPEGGFRVELPSEPERNVQSVPSQAGPLEAAVFTVEVSADLGYMVAYTDYPEEILNLDPVAALDQAVREAPTNVSGTLESSARLTVDGFPAVDYVIAVERGTLEARSILTGQRIYLVQRAASQPDQDEFRRLVDSFELLAT